MFAAPNASYRGGGDDGARPSEFGGAAVAVPTELHGLRLAWERHGTLPWRRLVEPAAALADGFAVGPELARAISENAEALKRFPATAAVFLRADASPLREGDVCRNAALARTLRRVAREGPSVLRAGALAEALARDVRDAGGVMTSEDLASYAPRARAAARGRAGVHRARRPAALLGRRDGGAGFRVFERVRAAAGERARRRARDAPPG